jgi:hypothetical protein
MYHYKTVLHGLSKFVDEDLIPKMSGLQRWIFGTGAGIALSKGDEMFHQYKNMPILHTLGLIEEDKINVTCIYKELLGQAEHGPIHVEIPMLGTITLDKTDVEKMYRYIID